LEKRKLEYRPDIDGLRAISVIAVILFHLNIFYLPGGFLGVDIFFVISGYLITSILIKEFRNNNLYLSNFYNRRIRRIIPLLLLVVLITNLISFFFLFPEELLNLFNTNLSIIFFFSNFYFWKNTDYFNDITSQSPLLHTWSLSVEEQFYIFFPIIFLFFLKFKKKNFFIFLNILIVFCSLLSASYLGKFSSDANFFFTTSRMFEIGIGVLCAFVVSEKLITKKFNRLFNVNFSIFFLILLLSSFVFLNKQNNLPNFLTLIPLIATVYFILNNNRKDLVFKFLSLKYMVVIGKSSYSLYLFHYPLFVFLNFYNFYLLKILSLPFLLITSYISWKYFETPFRNKKIINDKKLYTFLTIGIVILFYIFLNKDKFKNFFNSEISQNNFYSQMEKANNDRGKLLTQNCKLYTREINQDFIHKFNKCKSQHKNSVLIIGDSHADDLFNSYVLFFPNEKFVVGVGKGGCKIYEEKDECPYAEIVSFYLKNKDIIKYVFFTQIGSDYLTGYYKLPVQKDKIEKIVSYLNNFSKTETKVIWFGPQAEPGIMMNSYKSLRSIKSKKYDIYENKKITNVDIQMARIAKERKIVYISKLTAIKYQPDIDFFVDNNFTYSDTDHWTTFGENFFGKRLFSSEDFKKFYLE
jgi:peptidoglycan/LPS O-acetylase OafA/YrhL